MAGPGTSHAEGCMGGVFRRLAGTPCCQRWDHLPTSKENFFFLNNDRVTEVNMYLAILQKNPTNLMLEDMLSKQIDKFTVNRMRNNENNVDEDTKKCCY